MFKISVSLPGLTQRYTFNRLKDGTYFVRFGKEHKSYAKELRDSILGGPSIIFQGNQRESRELKIISVGVFSHFTV